MQQELQIFEYEDHAKIRTIIKDGNIWFYGADVCQSLDIKNTSDAYSRLEKDDIDTTDGVDAKGRKARVYVISEYGLYDLILQSRKAEAKKFKRWIIHDVIPQIRKTGTFTLKPVRSLPAFVRRFNDNWHRVENGYFSVISELYIRVHGRFEQLGCIIADTGPDGKQIRPDVSVGIHFSKYLKTYYPEHVSKRKKYLHVFEDGFEVEAWQYLNDPVLPIFIEYVETIWLKEHAPEYLEKRDPLALPYLAKILPTIKPAVRIAR